MPGEAVNRGKLGKVDPDAPAPAPSAEARRLIDDLRSKQRLHHPRHNAPAWFEEPKRQAVDAADRALSAYVAGLEVEVARSHATMAMPTHMLVPRRLPPGALRAAERHCDWSAFQHAWGAVLNWIEADAAQRGRAAEGGSGHAD